MITAANSTVSRVLCSNTGGDPYAYWQCYSTITRYPAYYSPKTQLLPYISDHNLTLVAPIIAYWLYSFFFYKLDTAGWKWANKYRIHTREEANAVNIASPSQVFWGVVVQQILQTLLGVWWFSADDKLHTVTTSIHHVQLQYYGDIMRPLVLRVFGNSAGNTLLPDFAYFAYWWAVPVFQFLLAMQVLNN